MGAGSRRFQYAIMAPDASAAERDRLLSITCHKLRPRSRQRGPSRSEPLALSLTSRRATSAGPAVRGVEETPTGTDRYELEPKGGPAVQITVGATVGSRRRPISGRMRHFRLWLLMVGVLSLVAEAVAAAAVFWRGTAPAWRLRP